MRDFCLGVFVFVFCCGTAAFPEELLSLAINGATLHVEIANTKQTREQGLQRRTELPADRGMLFVFPEKKTLAFWMKDTLIPLDIAFIDSEGCLFQIESMKPLSLHPVRSRKKCAFALEVRPGWFQEKGIGLETKLSLPESLKSGAS